VADTGNLALASGHQIPCECLHGNDGRYAGMSATDVPGLSTETIAATSIRCAARWARAIEVAASRVDRLEIVRHSQARSLRTATFFFLGVVVSRGTPGDHFSGLMAVPAGLSLSAYLEPDVPTR